VENSLRPTLIHLVELGTLLCSRPLPELESDWIHQLRSMGDRLLGRMDEISDLASIEEESLTLNERSFSLTDVVNHCCQLVSLHAGRRKADFVVAEAEDLPDRVVGDPDRLAQILVNLLENAVRYSYQGQVEIGIQRVPTDPDRCMLLFTVADEGIGMSDEQVDRLFGDGEPQQASLGLTVCKRLTGLMGGGMGVTSRLGVGSEFWFTVQLQPAETHLEPDLRADRELLEFAEPVA
jgi:two-component system, sensor histidine kinase and response regulator